MRAHNKHHLSRVFTAFLNLLIFVSYFKGNGYEGIALSLLESWLYEKIVFLLLTNICKKGSNFLFPDNEFSNF